MSVQSQRLLAAELAVLGMAMRGAFGRVEGKLR